MATEMAQTAAVGYGVGVYEEVIVNVRVECK